jgi:hypothetical protein
MPMDERTKATMRALLDRYPRGYVQEEAASYGLRHVHHHALAGGWREGRAGKTGTDTGMLEAASMPPRHRIDHAAGHPR